MARNWNGGTIGTNETNDAQEEETAARTLGQEKATDWESFYAGLKMSQRDVANRDLMRFVASDECKNDEQTFAYVDDYCERVYGIRPNHGDIWNNSDREAGRNQRFEDARKYARTMVAMAEFGYSSVCDPADREWIEARESGDRERQIALANVPTTETAAYQSAGATSPYVPTVWRSDEDVDADLAAYDAKVMSRFTSNTMSAYDAKYGFTDNERKMILDSVGGDGLAERHGAAFLEIARKDPSRAAAITDVIRCVASAKRKPFSDWCKAVSSSVSRQFEPFINEVSLGGRIGAELANRKYVREQGDRVWNDAKRAHYAFLVERQRNASGEAAAYMPDPREVVNNICAARLTDETMSVEKRREKRRARLLLENATEHVPFDGYGYTYQSLLGAASSIPYMAVSMAGVPGFAINTIAQFGSVRDDILANGGDPDEAVGMQLASAVAWSLIEKCEARGVFAKPLTALRKREIWMSFLHAPWKRGAISKVGKMALTASPELACSYACNVLQEGAQDALEEGTKTWFTKHDWNAVADAAGEGLESGIRDSLGSMAILTALGAPVRALVTRSNAIDAQSVVEYARQYARVGNMLEGKTADGASQDELAKTARKRRVMDEITKVWRSHVEDGTGAVAAVDEITEKYGLSDEERKSVVDYFDIRSTIEYMAEVEDERGKPFSAEQMRKIAGGMLTVGGSYEGIGDTVNDPLAFFERAFPNSRAEIVERSIESDNLKQARERVENARKAIGEAQDRKAKRAAYSERHHAEQALAEAERDNEENGERERLIRWTFPTGKSVTINYSSQAPNVDTPSFGASVENAVDGLGLVDATKMSDDEFRAIPSDEKILYAVTPGKWTNAMTHDERVTYLTAHGLTSGGNFSVTDENGAKLTDTDALITLMAANGPGMTKGGNFTLGHESGHMAETFARATGQVTPEVERIMKGLFGAPREGVDELWDTEAMSDMFRDYLRDKLDYTRMTTEQRKAVEPFFRNAWRSMKAVFGLTGRESVAPVDLSERDRAMETAFEGLRSGDLSGLSAFAGIDFSEDESKPNEQPSQDALEAASTPSEQETANDTPKAKETPPAPSRPPSSAHETKKLDDTQSQTVDIRPVSPENAPLRAGTKRTIFTPGYEMSVEADVMWTPLSSLVESTDDREVQMRDRSRVATDQQVLTKTRKGVFQPLALFPGTKSDDGAPIVGGGLRIISGHGRKRMLDQLVREGRFGEYLNAVNAEAARQGLPTAPSEMEHPVLVSRVTGGLDRRDDLTRFAELSNRWGGLERSAAEHAESDARKISDAMLRLYSPDASGNLLAASNRPFMSAFLNEVGATGLTNADGTPNAEAALRVQRAMMTALFGNDERTRAIVQNLLERNQELSLASLQNTLLKSAGKLLSMKRRHGSFDVVSDVREASYQYIAWRSAQTANPKLTLFEHLNQNDFFADEVPPMQQALALLLESGRFGAVIEKYSELVAQQADDMQTTFAGIAENRTPLQLIGLAERALVSADETPVTPDPESAMAAEPVQTPPAASIEPPPAPTPSKEPASANANPVETAQEIIAPPEPETFTPAPLKRGTATLPGPGAAGIVGYQVNADGTPSTEKRNLPPGAYNLLRAPYDVRRPPAMSAQDRAGRGLHIANPPPTGHANIFPHFQGNKTEMAARTSQAIRRIMPRAEREHYETVVDYFGGGGCWGLYHALENFPNARYLVVNEWDEGRIEKIRLMHEIDGQVADRAKAIIDTFVDELRSDCEVARDGGESGSGATIAHKLGPRIERYTGEERGALTAFYDCAVSMLYNNFDENGRASFDLGMARIYGKLREDGRKAKAAADEFRARGGTIRYRRGDAASFPDAPAGDRVVAVCDPPYYLTKSYNSDGSNAGIVTLDGDGWSYSATRNLLRDLVDKGDAIVYTDEAWWHKESYRPNAALGDDLFGNKSDFDREQEILLDITNTLDHFDVAGRVVGRQEVLGIHHGHDTKSKIGEGGIGDGPSDARTASDGRGDTGNNRYSVRRMAGGAEGEGRPVVSSGSGRGREGRRALAREVVVRDIAATIAAATDDLSPQTADTVARATAALVRQDRLADYCAFAKANAEKWKRAETPLYDGALPIPIEMRADQSVPDVRYSVKRVTPAEDAAYMDAARRGDMETAQRMVREAAAKAGYDEKFGFYLKNGIEIKRPNYVIDNVAFLYGKALRDKYRTTEMYSRPNVDWNNEAYNGDGKQVSVEYKGKKYSFDYIMSYEEPSVYAMIDAGLLGEEKPKYVFARRIGHVPESGASYNFRDQRAESGVSVLGVYEGDGFKSQNDGTYALFNSGKEYVVSGQLIYKKGSDGEPLLVNAEEVSGNLADIKSADPVTYDNAGNIIPLSKRFDPNDDDIRHSVRKSVQTASETPAERAAMRHTVFVGEKLANVSPKAARTLSDAQIALSSAEANGYGYNAVKVEIYENTGWWQGTDGKWRFEIKSIKPVSAVGKTDGRKHVLNGLEIETNDALFWNGKQVVTDERVDDDPKAAALWELACYVEYGCNLDDAIAAIESENAEGGNLDVSVFRNGKYEVRNVETGKLKCRVKDVCTHRTLFSAYPDMAEIEVEVSDAETMNGFAGLYSPLENKIELPKHAFESRDGEPTNVLTEKGLEILTHELQHAVQTREGFTVGADPRIVGRSNYRRMAGEVEARNAASRIGEPFEKYASTAATRSARMDATFSRLDPWHTQDTRNKDQLVYNETGDIVDGRGRHAARHSVIAYNGEGHAGNGYDGYSMSNNARHAYENGEMPKSKWTKEDILNGIDAIDNSKTELAKGIPLAVLKSFALTRSSWHHSSSWYNETDFYSVDEQFVKDLTEESAKRMKSIEVGKDRNAKVYKGSFDYIEWSGTRNHPKPIKHHIDNAIIEERGSFYYVTDESGNKIKKKIGSNGTFATDYEAERIRKERERARAKREADYTTKAAIEFLGAHLKEGRDGIDRLVFEPDRFSPSNSGNVYAKGRKPERHHYENGLDRFFRKGEKRASRNRYGGFSIETWDGEKWIMESDSFAQPTDETRHSVRRPTASTARKPIDLATALVASRRLAGKETKPEDVDRILRNLGLTERASDVIANATAMAETNREKLRGMVERNDPELVSALVRQGLASRLERGLDDVISGAAADADPDVGAKVQKAIQAKETRDLMNATGFDAAQMLAELPIDLSEAVFAVAEYEKTPEELARLEEARKRRLETEQDGDDEEAAEERTFREPTAEERAALDDLMNRARFREETRAFEEQRKKAAKRRANENDKNDTGDDAACGGDGFGDDANGIPIPLLRRIAPVFETPDMFAAFIVEWTADHVVAKHPELPNSDAMWKSPVAIRELKQTATHILRRLAMDVLGSPSLNYSRNFADHAINELESDAECKTFNSVRGKISRIYRQIHDNALTLSRRKMVANLEREIRKRAVDGKRFSSIKEELKRKIDAKTEQWCRWLIPAMTMSEEKLQEEINRLTAIVSVDPADEQATPEDKLREAADHLAVLHKYGGMIRWMPGRIADAETEIMQLLDGRRQAFEARREEHLARDKAVRDAIIAAVQQGATSSYRTHTKLGDAVDRYTSAMMGNLTLEMQNLIRYCTDPDLRTAALNAIEEMQTWISEGGSRYRTILGTAQAELHDGLAQCYGNAEDGIRHLLRDEIPTEAATAIFTQGRDRVPTYGQLLQLYASTIQADYRENAVRHGRTAVLPLMESTLTDADRRFHAWSVEWFRRNRNELSNSVEAVTGLPVTSPDALYTPVRILREKSGFDAEGVGWSPVPSALNRRVRHGLDFNEGTNFLSCLQEQAEVRAQTIGYAEIGIRLRDTIAHGDVQAAVRSTVGKRDMKIVTDHVRDVLIQNAARKNESAFWAPLNVARKWMARFYLSGNIPSAMKQLASMPVWANAMVGGRTVGLARCMHYLTTVGTEEGREALREIMSSDGFRARYTMGWSEETQNVLMNPSRSRMMRYVERAFDKGMVVNKAVDGVSCLWMAQGFYRDATQSFMERGFTEDEAKRKAMALTWSCLESGQQSGRLENMTTLQRRGGAGVAAIFQFKTAYLLQNNYLIQSMREMRAGTPGARGRFLRAIFINTVWIPAFVSAVNAAWSAIMGEPEPPEDEDRIPSWFAAFAWSMIDGVTAPMFGLDAAIHTLYDQMTDTRNWRQDSEIPALSGAIRVSRDAARVIYDLGKFGLQSFDAFDFEEELTADKLVKEANRLVKDLLAPYRHGAKAVENRTREN